MVNITTDQKANQILITKFNFAMITTKIGTSNIVKPAHSRYLITFVTQKTKKLWQNSNEWNSETDEIDANVAVFG